MEFWNKYSPKSFLASCLWNLSEWSGIGLGRFAPSIFGAMIGAKRKTKHKK